MTCPIISLAMTLLSEQRGNRLTEYIKKNSTEGIRTFNTLFQPWQAFNLPRESSAAIRNEHNFIKQRANTKWPMANTIVDLSLVARLGFQGEVKTEGKNRKEAKKNPKKPTTLISNK